MGKKIDDQRHKRLLERGVADIIVKEELVKLLESGRTLRIKQGFDPSCPDIHLGHVVSLRKMRQFQELGHEVTLIVGDWTAQIGDPSGESQTRPMLTAEEVKANAETYMQQFFKVVDRQSTKVVWQSEWFGKFSLADVISLTSKFTVAQMLQRDDFSKRYAAGRPIAVTEFLYPLLQAYDSVVVEADVELGGIDQTFNCLVGRELQGMVGQPPQQVFLVPLLVGTDGSMKMSKSLGNYIGVDEPPAEMYGKVMSIPDALLMDYFELLTDVPDEELKQFRRDMDADAVNPMDLKKRLAHEIVAQFYDEKAAADAEKNFRKTVQKKEVPDEVVEIRISFEQLQNEAMQLASKAVRANDLQALNDAIVSESGSVENGRLVREHLDVPVAFILPKIGLAPSRSEAKRLSLQGAIEVDGERVTDDIIKIKDGSIIKVGKRRYVKIVDAAT